MHGVLGAGSGPVVACRVLGGGPMGVLVASTELPLSRSCIWAPPKKKTQPPSTGLQEGDTGSGEEGGEDAGAGDPSPPRSLGQGEAGGSGQGQGGQHRGGQGGPGRQRGAAGAAAAEAVQGVGVAVADVHRQPARGSRARGQAADLQKPPGHPLDPPPFPQTIPAHLRMRLRARRRW